MSSIKDFVSSEFSPIKGKTTWASPSNIALVKYWGKYGDQFPQNPSLSFTLSKCVTTTSVAFKPRDVKSDHFSFSFFLILMLHPKQSLIHLQPHGHLQKWLKNHLHLHHQVLMEKIFQIGLHNNQMKLPKGK